MGNGCVSMRRRVRVLAGFRGKSVGVFSFVGFEGRRFYFVLKFVRIFFRFLDMTWFCFRVVLFFMSFFIRFKRFVCSSG